MSESENEWKTIKMTSEKKKNSFLMKNSQPLSKINFCKIPKKNLNKFSYLRAVEAYSSLLIFKFKTHAHRRVNVH